MPRETAILPLAELIEQHVPQEAEVFFGGFAFSDPLAAARELVRQGREDLRVLKTSGGLLVDLLVGAGLVSQMVFCHVWNSVGPQPAHAFRRALQSGQPRAVDIEELSYGAYAMGLAAGAWGLPFMPTTPLLGTGHDTVRRLVPDKLATLNSPFGNGEQVSVVRAIRPKIGIFHVQRIDQYGNAQMFGPTAEMRQAIAACDHVLITAEELVDTEVIRAAPELTVAPGFMVAAASIVPFGAHPTDCAGYYARDLDHHDLYGSQTSTTEGFDAYLSEWVSDLAGPEAYRGKLGDETIRALSTRDRWW